MQLVEEEEQIRQKRKELTVENVVSATPNRSKTGELEKRAKILDYRKRARRSRK